MSPADKLHHVAGHEFLERDFLRLAVAHDGGGDLDHRLELGGGVVGLGFLDEPQRHAQHHHHHHHHAADVVAGGSSAVAKVRMASTYACLQAFARTKMPNQLASQLLFHTLTANYGFQSQINPTRSVRPSDTIEFKALLLVDDDKQLASALQWILADENFLVDVANDGDEALMKVKANEYDAVVCDVMMPKLRGDEFYIQARELRPVLADRFIFITGYAADPKINLFLTQTDSKYLMKPFPIQHLINCLKELLE
jgi:CheY-like chemotaxis protein